MNFSEITPNEIYRWIKDRDNGNSENYDKGKEDTQVAIEVFSSLYGSTFRTPYQLFIYLYEKLCMRNVQNQSFYRAFIALQNDDVITIRLSQHFATKGSIKTANQKFGKPNVEYHLIIERTQMVNPDNNIFYDRRYKSVTFKIREMDLTEFNDGHFRKDTIDEIIKLLTYGEGDSGNNNLQINTESKNKKVIIRLTETRLHDIIRKSVSQILQEEYEGYKNYAEYAKYRPIGKKKFQTKYGNEIESVVTLRSGSGQMCHIVEDDHCYVLYNQLSFEDEAAPVTHIFPDAFEILKKLPNPQ